MTHIVDSLRRQQKMIVLGAALAVITLYIIPLDQIVNALHPSIGAALDRIAAIKARISADSRIPQDVKDRINGHLDQVSYRLNALGI